MARPPLRDVARIAGVSEPTVSRVLNGRRGVATGTRERVLAAIADLGYDESVARNRTTTGVVGVVAPELDNPVWATFLQALDARFAAHGFATHVGSATTASVSEERQVQVMLDREVDGIVFLAGRHADTSASLDHYERLVDRSVPIVLVNGRETELAVPHLFTDEGRAARVAVEHLIRLGHREIGLVIGPRRFIPSQRMVEGYERVMRSYDLPVRPENIVETLFTVEGGHAAAASLFDNDVSAVLAGNDLMALGVIRAARAQGIEVPRRCSVVGYDGTALTAFFDPPLTSLRQPIDAISDMAADALASEIDGSHRHRGAFSFSAELVARGSTAPY